MEFSKIPPAMSWKLATRFHQQGHENLQHVNEILEVMEENKENMTRTSNNITAMMSDYTTVSRKLHTLKNLTYITLHKKWSFL